MTKRIILAFVIIVILAFLLFTSQIIPTGLVLDKSVESGQNLLFSYQIFHYQSNVTIINLTEGFTIGVVTDPDNLNFGKIPAGGSYGTRFINITNTEDEEVFVRLDAYGNISHLVQFKKNNFFLNTGETAELEIILNTTQTTKTGDYNGVIELAIAKPRNPLASPFLSLM
jgi:hypothetical protein